MEFPIGSGGVAVVEACIAILADGSCLRNVMLAVKPHLWLLCMSIVVLRFISPPFSSSARVPSQFYLAQYQNFLAIHPAPQKPARLSTQKRETHSGSSSSAPRLAHPHSWTAAGHHHHGCSCRSWREAQTVSRQRCRGGSREKSIDREQSLGRRHRARNYLKSRKRRERELKPGTGDQTKEGQIATSC